MTHFHEFVMSFSNLMYDSHDEQYGSVIIKILQLWSCILSVSFMHLCFVLIAELVIVLVYGVIYFLDIISER